MAADTLLTNKRLVWEFQQKMSAADAVGMISIIKGYLHEDVVWHGPHPFNELKDQGAILQNFWKPFAEAFPDFERHNDIFLGGSFKSGEWISSTGHYVATFTKDWLGIPANGQLITIRFGEFCRIQDGKIKEMYVLLDMLDLMRQVDLWPLKKSLGAEGWWPKPHTSTGLIVKPQDHIESRKTSKLIANWTNVQKEFSSGVLNVKLMRHEEYFDRKCLMYGSSGIGANRGIEGFKKQYQEPMLHAFDESKYANHLTHFADGRYMAGCGWEGITGIHKHEFLGIEPTENKVKLRTMEWWRRSGDLIKETWVMVDMVDLLLQLGVDEFARMRDAQAEDQWL